MALNLRRVLVTVLALLLCSTSLVSLAHAETPSPVEPTPTVTEPSSPQPAPSASSTATPAEGDGTATAVPTPVEQPLDTPLPVTSEVERPSLAEFEVAEVQAASEPMTAQARAMAYPVDLGPATWALPLLGQPTSAATPITGGRYQPFEYGYVYWTTGARGGLFLVFGDIAAAYRGTNAHNGSLGLPISDETRIATGGSYQRFTNGLVYRNDSGTHYVFGGIGQRYLALGGHLGYLGQPTSSEILIAPGVVVQTFTGGSLYWTTTGLHEVSGGFGSLYRATGAHAGPLGLPTGPEVTVRGGVYQQFANGSISWGPAGVHAVIGALDVRLRGTGGYTGYLGFPAGAQLSVNANTVGQAFTGGYLYGTSAGVYEVSGGFGRVYRADNAHEGVLGLPTGNEESVPGGVVQRFAGGLIYWGPAGVYTVTGGIGSLYRAHGAHASIFGLPLSGEDPIPGRSGVVQRFQRGQFYYSSTTGVQFVFGAIGQAYQASGGATGPLGLPTGVEYAIPGGSRQLFEKGAISYRAGVGTKLEFTAAAVPYTRNDTFINAIAPMAQLSQQIYGVPASVTIAQAILESGWGGSTLSRYGQAYFGVKCTSSYGAYATGCIPLPTWEVYNGVDVIVWAHFRSYDSLTDSVLDHGHFLRNNSRYAPAFLTTDAVAFAQAIHRAGYATDPAYASKLAGIISANNLTRFDYGAPAGVVPVTGAIGAHYQALGGPGGVLGTAVGIESDGPVAGSRLVSFDRGVITSAPGAGVHALYGDIWNRYRLDPNLRGLVGVPTTDEFAAGSAVGQQFQRGVIYRTGPGTTQLVFGGIYATYQGAGGHAGPLGVPTSGEQAYGAGVIQYFTGGSITWDASRGAVVHLN